MPSINAPKSAAPTADMFRQLKPCTGCPFLREGGIYHNGPALLAYADYFTTFPGNTFPCHKSVPADDDRQAFSAWRVGQTLCAGGLIYAEKQGHRNAIMVWGITQGWYDPAKLQERETVVDTVDELLANAKEPVCR